MVEKLLNLALIGGEPILYLLVFLSILSVAVVAERLWVYLRNRIDLPGFSSQLVTLLNKKDIDGAVKLASSINASEARVAKVGLVNFSKGVTVAQELMESETMREQQRLDRGLTFLGTIGSNTPFIGLLGTVLGIIKAFHDLARDTQGGPSVVMAGIAEALVATAVGLLVAIPAVVFFNYFKSRQKRILSHIAQLQRTIQAFISVQEKDDEANGRKTETQGKKS